jgi:D-cysteine desulfhydrase
MLAAAPLLQAPPRQPEAPAKSFERLVGALPRLPLTQLPTPVTEAQALGEHLGLRLFVKQDDLASEVYAGSKVRKLEFFLGHARQLGCTHLVTGGSLGSHHALATAIHGSRRGFSVELLLLPEPSSDEARRVLQASAAYASSVRYVATARDLEVLWREAMSHYKDTYSIPLGGSSPLGNVAYIQAALELERQVDAHQLPEPDRIYVPMGTMGCAVGLLLGLRMTKLRSRLVAVRASNPGTSSLAKFRDLYAETNEWLRAQDPAFPTVGLDESDFYIDGRHLGGGYAIATEEGKSALRLAQQHANLRLELTYTAKALAAIVADASTLRGRPVMLWNTHAGDPPERALAPERLPKELRHFGVTRAR